MLSVLRESGGTAVAVSEEEMVDGVRELCRQPDTATYPYFPAVSTALSRSRATRTPDRCLWYSR